MILIEIKNDDMIHIDEINHINGIYIINKKGFDGDIQIIELMVNAALVSLSFLTGFLIEKIRNKAKIKIKTKDIEVEGVSEETIQKILEQIYNKPA